MGGGEVPSNSPWRSLPGTGRRATSFPFRPSDGSLASTLEEINPFGAKKSSCNGYPPKSLFFGVGGVGRLTYLLG